MSTQASPHLTKPALHENPHWPRTHVAEPLAGSSQPLPQEPQCAGSVWMSTQLVPHLSSPVPQLKSQLPELHSAMPPTGFGHTVAQSPQWFLSCVRSTHDAPHWTSGGVQEVSQLPELQTSPVSHTVPQLPQFAGSLAVCAQPAEHSV